jgi:VanZ family protein
MPAPTRGPASTASPQALYEPTRGRAFLWLAAYLAFVIYGSLIPFELRHLEPEQALRSFAHIPYLDLGMASRADWVANLVLYIPLAFLGCAWLAGMRTTSRLRYPALILVLVLCLAIAVAIEFTQLYFAPRTVSLNDLLAETLGTLAGILLWSFGREPMMRLKDAFARGGRSSVLAAAVAYGLVYLVLALFPYDFVISLDELARQLSSPRNGWLLSAGCGATARCSARLAADALGIAPLGILLALGAPSIPVRRFLLAGILVGVGLEGLQLLLASGTAQGLSALLRAAGLAAGATFGQALRRHGTHPPALLIRSALPWLALPYLWLLAKLGGLLSASWLPPGQALARLPTLRMMPFYHHYFSTEPAAMASLLAQAGLYAPIGLALWARNAALHRPHRGAALQAALWTSLVALAVELTKLMVPGKHPDLTDVLIGAVAAALAYRMARWLEQVLSGAAAAPAPAPAWTPAWTPASVSPAPVHVPSPTARANIPECFAPRVQWPAPHPIGALIGTLAALAALLGLADYPLAPPVTAILLVGYAAAVRVRPHLMLVALPALLPSLSLSPITGRLWIDEFDLVVLVSLAVGYWRVFGARPLPWPSLWLPIALGLLWATWLAATARGLWPLWHSSAGLAPGSHTAVEAWMVGKGLLWALLLAPILRRLAAADAEMAGQRFLDGVLLGLAAAIFVVLLERHVFVGLDDFENVFRVTATFSNMNTGGAYIEAFIAFAFPVLAVWVLGRDDWPTRLLGLAGVAAASYAMLVTFSRVGYVALAAGLAVVAVGTLRHRTGSAHRGLVLAGLAAAAVAAAVPVLSGGFAQQRLAGALQDLGTRQAHWFRALGLMDDGPLAALLGMGFGRYPSLYLFRGRYERPPGTFSLRREGENHYLSLGVGEPLFLDQRVEIEPGAHYRLSVRLREPYGDASLKVFLCEKALLYSFACVSTTLAPEGAEGHWVTVTKRIDTGRVGSGGPWPHRPVRLSLYNPGRANIVEIESVSLQSSDGHELLRNGGFDDELAGWLFVTDQDLAWHIHEQWVEVYFAQGMLGVTALLLLLIGVSRPLGRGLLAGDPLATAFAGALAGFLTVGLLSSTMDTARLSMLFYSCALGAALALPRAAR